MHQTHIDRRKVTGGLITGTGATALILGLMMAGGPAAQAATSCTPEAGWTVCTQFDYSGADQTYTVPSGITSISVKVWGAAGAPGADAAHGGGFSTGIVSVTPGETLTVSVGGRGLRNSMVPTYGGGGAGGSATRDADPANGILSWTIGGSGGGLSGVWLGAYGANPLLIAGGSGATAPTRVGEGGGGGGAQAPTINDPEGASGSGGGQSAGGLPGDNGVCTVPAGAGLQYLGGAGSGGADGGSGGGGGYFGGGGGVCQDNEGDANNEGAGGGGSGYLDPARVSLAVTDAAVGVPSAGAADPLYVAGVGESDPFANLTGDGMVIIQSLTPTAVPSTPQQAAATGQGGTGLAETGPAMVSSLLMLAAGLLASGFAVTAIRRRKAAQR